MNYRIPVFVGAWVASLLITWVVATRPTDDSAKSAAPAVPSLPSSASAVGVELEMASPKDRLSEHAALAPLSNPKEADASSDGGEPAVAETGKQLPAKIVSAANGQPLTLAQLREQFPEMGPRELQEVWRQDPGLVQKLFASALVSDDLVARNATIAKVLSSMTAANAPDLLSVFEDAPKGFHADNDYRLFLHAWGKLDGKAAMSYLLQQPDAHKVDHGQVWAMSGWAQTDPHVAAAFLKGGEYDHVGGLYYGLIRGWARTDLDAAETYLMGMENRERRNHLARVLGESYFEQQGADGALQWATVLATTAHEFGDNQGYAHQALGDVLRRVAANDSLAAAAWVQENIEAPYLQPWMFEQATNRIVKDDLDLALGLMATVDAHLLNGDTVRNVIGELASREGLSAFQHIGDLRPDLRHHAYGAAARRMGQDQLDSLGHWLQNAPNAGHLDEARGVYAHRILNQNPDDAFAQIAHLSSVGARDRVTYGLLQRVQHTKPELVEQWLPTMSEGARRKFVAENKK